MQFLCSSKTSELICLELYYSYVKKNYLWGFIYCFNFLGSEYRSETVQRTNWKIGRYNLGTLKLEAQSSVEWRNDECRPCTIKQTSEQNEMAAAYVQKTTGRRIWVMAVILTCTVQNKCLKERMYLCCRKLFIHKKYIIYNVCKNRCMLFFFCWLAGRRCYLSRIAMFQGCLD